MAIDPSKFQPLNVADTCAVWNVLSSKLLYATARAAKCEFCITTFVRYECLTKQRRTIDTSEHELIERLKAEEIKGNFQSHSCGIGDLQSIRLLERRKRLGIGELSSIAFAMRINQAVITDDMKARKLSEESGHTYTQTTPHLLSWLIFSGHLQGSDTLTVVAQHEAVGRPLKQHLERACELALQSKLYVSRG